MKHIEYFKLQAKNLFKDYKTQSSYIDEVDGNSYYKYQPTYFDIDGIFLDFDWDEEDFSLMKAQHLIALILGFNKWADLLKASEAELELAKLLFDNEDKMHLEDWKMYIAETEAMNQTTFDPESRLEILKEVLLAAKAFGSGILGYRINRKSV